MYDFKDQIEDSVLGNKALFLFHYRSLSSAFFLFLSVTCKYRSHNSPLNNTRLHEIYGWSRARAGLGVVRVYGPWEVRTKSPKCSGHIKLPSSSRAPYGSKTREHVGNPTTCRTSPQDFSKLFRLVWAP